MRSGPQLGIFKNVPQDPGYASSMFFQSVRRPIMVQDALPNIFVPQDHPRKCEAVRMPDI